MRELATRVYNEIWDDGLLDSAAQLAYYFLFALFPLLIFLTSIFGFVVGSDGGLQKSLFNYLGQVLPSTALDLVNSVITEVSQTTSGGKLTLGLLLALWAASSGVEATTQSLNRVYDIKETRPWWKLRLMAIFLTIALALLIISALIIVLFGGQIADWLAASYGFGTVFTTTWKILQWFVVLAFVLLAFALIYYFSPDVEEQKWYFITPGSVVGVALWLLVSFVFRIYLQYFDSYSATYGSLGAVIILMLWLYFTGAAILIGGEINSEIENAAAKSGAPEAKRKGEKSPNDGGRESLKEQKSATTATDAKGKDKPTKIKQKSVSVISEPQNIAAAKSKAKDNLPQSETSGAQKNIFTKVVAVASMITGVFRSFRSK